LRTRGFIQVGLKQFPQRFFKFRRSQDCLAIKANGSNSPASGIGYIILKLDNFLL